MTPANNMDEGRELLQSCLPVVEQAVASAKEWGDGDDISYLIDLTSKLDAFLKNDSEEAPSNKNLDANATAGTQQTGTIPDSSADTEGKLVPSESLGASISLGEEVRIHQDCRSLYEFLLWNLCRTEPYPVIDFKLRAEKVLNDDGDRKRVLVRFYIHADGVDSQTPVFTLEEPRDWICGEYKISDLIHFGSWHQKAMEVPHFPASTSLKEEPREK